MESCIRIDQRIAQLVHNSASFLVLQAERRLNDAHFCSCGIEANKRHPVIHQQSCTDQI